MINPFEKQIQNLGNFVNFLKALQQAV